MKRRQQQRLKGRGLEGALRSDPQRSGTPLEIENLSRGGLFACSRFALEIGAIVWFDFEHPVDRVRFTVKGRVVGVVTPQEALRKGIAAGFGVEFLELGALEKARIEQLLGWLHDPKAYADRAAARRAAPAKNEHLSAFDFAFKSLTDENDFSWSGMQQTGAGLSRTAHSGAQRTSPGVTPPGLARRPASSPSAQGPGAQQHAAGPSSPDEQERKRLAYVRFLEHERVRLLTELDEKKRRLAQLGHT